MEKYKFSQVNPNRWSEEEKVLRHNYHCVHHHTGLSHPLCYNRENGIEERKACLDIEAGGLNADFDIMLSWVIKTSGKGEYLYDYLTKEDLNSASYDKRIMGTLMEALWNYDRIVTHYGSAWRFDIPFIRARYLWLKARGLYKGKPFPEYGMMWSSDTFAMAKRCLKIASRRQDAVANVILGKDIKTRIDKDYWLAVKYGTPKQRIAAIKYIVDHNLKDAEQLDGNYLTLLPFVREVRSCV